MAKEFGGVSVSEIMRGLPELNAALDEMKKATDAATLAGMKAGQQVAKTSVKSMMRGRPRWDHRGASQRTGPDISLNLSPHHVTKSGGPGQLTGSMRSAVGVVKRPKKIGDTYQGGIGCGGGRTPTTNLYKWKVNGAYPFMQPGVRKVEPQIGEAFKVAWAKAMET